MVLNRNSAELGKNILSEITQIVANGFISIIELIAKVNCNHINNITCSRCKNNYFNYFFSRRYDYYLLFNSQFSKGLEMIV